jgi:predicted N-acyltransferase
MATVRVKARPDFYGAPEVAVQFALLNLGFTVEACELNFHLDLAGMTGVDDYVARLKPPARRALKHLAAEPFVFCEATSEDEWAAAYGVLERNRQAKGWQLRLPLDYVRGIRDAFPGRIRMFTLAHGGRPCAAALVYRVRPRRELVVYWGDADHDLPRSPMNVLVQRLVGWAVEEGALSLDVGTSSVEGVPNQGLIQFKESVGARPRLRLDLVKQL